MHLHSKCDCEWFFRYENGAWAEISLIYVYVFQWKHEYCCRRSLVVQIFTGGGAASSMGWSLSLHAFNFITVMVFIKKSGWRWVYHISKKKHSEFSTKTARSSLIHFECIGVAPIRLVTPRPFEGEQLQCRQNGSNLIYITAKTKILLISNVLTHVKNHGQKRTKPMHIKNRHYQRDFQLINRIKSAITCQTKVFSLENI